MTILKLISLIFLYEQPPCVLGMCSNNNDIDEEICEHGLFTKFAKIIVRKNFVAYGIHPGLYL